MTPGSSRHADLMDAAAFWRQFPVMFYFENEGDEIAGALISYAEEGSPKDPVPRIRIQTKDGRLFDVVAHQERLKAALVKAAPARGDRIRIVYTGEADRAAPGMSKAKLFTVDVIRPGSQSRGRPENTAGSATENALGTGENPR